MNGCMNIMKNLLLYLIECDYDEWLCEYYESSSILLYWMLIIMHGCMSITRGLLLYCIEH